MTRRQMPAWLCGLLLWAALAGLSRASSVLPLAAGEGALLPAARPLETVAAPLIGGASRMLEDRGGARAEAGEAGSLFAGRLAGGLFAPVAPRPAPMAPGAGKDRRKGFAPLPPGSPAERLRHLIARVEAGAEGYDAVVYSATRPPPKPPSRMTIAEIRHWIAATPGQDHAIGRYQFIPSTLEELLSLLGVPPRAVFDPALQDRLADLLLMQAGYADFLEGRLPRAQFMENLAGIWAGLPTRSGRSRYHGVGQNRAGITWARFEAEMARIFPA
ncbi:hypothetical protein KM176_11865 [Pseudooceanicola sp. CBS1P-1]|uniref:Muramidase n=1 Tax=Pseudooceanicola albus TaxID=2692189 RepID=A0A6L7G2X8_9RHOB|nr:MULTISPECIES: glycoside hydrolase family 104 protein [Pseudooceanicola]MBT9384557.1 hypothetical protein [Pseudooceanicola endophyticus]MXN18259.1 hypothetical protein [Pseudooceanicola albus]